MVTAFDRSNWIGAVGVANLRRSHRQRGLDHVVGHGHVRRGVKGDQPWPWLPDLSVASNFDEDSSTCRTQLAYLRMYCRSEPDAISAACERRQASNRIAIELVFELLRKASVDQAVNDEHPESIRTYRQDERRQAADRKRTRRARRRLSK